MYSNHVLQLADIADDVIMLISFRLVPVADLNGRRK
jgi:hypothetical protein